MFASLGRPRTVNKTGFLRDLKSLREKAREEGNETRDRAFTECIIAAQNSTSRRSALTAAIKERMGKEKGKERKVAFVEALLLLRKH